MGSVITFSINHKKREFLKDMIIWIQKGQELLYEILKLILYLPESNLWKELIILTWIEIFQDL